MKKAMALVLSLVMVFSMALTVNAAPTKVTSDANVEAEVLFGNGTDFDSYYPGEVGGYYDVKAIADMSEVNDAVKVLIAKTSVDKAKNASISGNFELKVVFDSTLNVSEINSSNFKYDIDGDEAAFAKFFNIPTDSDIVMNGDELTVNVSIKSGIKGEDVYDFSANKSLIGKKINITCADAVYITREYVYSAVGSATGKTLITGTDAAKEYEINYKFVDVDGNDEIEGNIELRLSGSGSGSSSGGSKPTYRPSGTTPSTPSTPSQPSKVSVKFVTAGGTVVSSSTVDAGTTIDLTKVDAGKREGYAFAGWSVNGVVSETAVITKDTVVKAKWINLVAPEEFVSDKHIAYIQGYPDGTAKPEADITREEVATILYRLLTDAKRESIASKENNFSDVAADRWSNEAISTLANGGYISGYEDGTFKPEQTITRAEFVTIISRFISGTAADAGYADMNGHWAKEAVNKVVDKAWVEGYTDGTFKPDAKITRAEVATIVNRMLVRYADKDSLAYAAITFADNTPDAWYYEAMLEATNGHNEFDRDENGYSEKWNWKSAKDDAEVKEDSDKAEDVDSEVAEDVDAEAETEADAEETENVEDAENAEDVEDNSEAEDAETNVEEEK